MNEHHLDDADAVHAALAGLSEPERRALLALADLPDDLEIGKVYDRPATPAELGDVDAEEDPEDLAPAVVIGAFTVADLRAGLLAGRSSPYNVLMHLLSMRLFRPGGKPPDGYLDRLGGAPEYQP